MSDYTCSNPPRMEKLRNRWTADPTAAPLPPLSAWHTEGLSLGA
jgi:hypothetical protein